MISSFPALPAAQPCSPAPVSGAAAGPRVAHSRLQGVTTPNYCSPQVFRRPAWRRAAAPASRPALLVRSGGLRGVVECREAPGLDLTCGAIRQAGLCQQRRQRCRQQCRRLMLTNRFAPIAHHPQLCALPVPCRHSSSMQQLPAGALPPAA